MYIYTYLYIHTYASHIHSLHMYFMGAVGTKYHNVAPPMGIRAEDGVMGGRGDYIRPVMGGSVSLDPTKVHICIQI